MTAPDANGWMPIETAPKDGGLVLLIQSSRSNYHGYYVAYWNEDIDEWKFHVGGIVRNPSHWQPLPKPPVSSC